MNLLTLLINAHHFQPILIRLFFRHKLLWWFQQNLFYVSQLNDMEAYLIYQKTQ